MICLLHGGSYQEADYPLLPMPEEKAFQMGCLTEEGTCRDALVGQGSLEVLMALLL